MKKQSFTLIELFVVIAIIAILAGMLLPALGKARDRAKSTGCLNQLKQIGAASNMYTMENADWFVCSGAQMYKAWVYNLAYGCRTAADKTKRSPYGLKYDGDYTDSYIYPSPGNAFACPANQIPFGPGGYSATQYAANSALCGYPAGGYYAKTRAIKSGARAVFAGDYNHNASPFYAEWHSYLRFLHGKPAYQKLGTTSGSVISQNSAVNFVFVDGHAAQRTLGQMQTAPDSPATASYSKNNRLCLNWCYDGIDFSALKPAK